MKRFLQFVVLAVLLTFCKAARAQTQVCDLNATPANFTAQLAAAQTGQTLCLTSGNYSATNGKSGVTVVSIPEAAASIAGSNPVSGARFVGINWTGTICMTDAQNVLIDRGQLVNLGQSCNEGRITLRGNGAGTVISNSLFQGGASDGIQLTGSATGYHIGPGNIFRNILQGGCGVTHCDAIQFYGGSNNVIDGNWFDNDSTILMSPDCNGSPMTFTNNVVNQEAGSAAAALTLGGTTSADKFVHNTMIRGGFRVYGGNPGNCSAGAVPKDNLSPGSGVVFVGGSNPTSYAGFALALGSVGIGAASDGLNLGINVVGAAPPVPSAPAITTTSLPAGVVGSSYAVSFSAVGTAPITWSSTSSVPGLNPLSSSGSLSGTPTVAGTYAFAVSASNTVGSAAQAYNIVISAQAPPSSGPKVNDRIKVNALANVRSTAVNNGFGALLGTEPAGALGTVAAVSSAAIPNSSAVWIQVKFDSCSASIPNCTGWMGSDNMTVVTTPAPTPVVVTVSPASTTVLVGQAVQFTVQVDNTTNTAVTWSASKGSITSSGIYTAPATGGSATVTAKSIADPSKTSSATVIVPVPALTVDCAAAKQAFTATNVPTGAALSVTGTLSGVAATCTTTLP